MIGCLGILAYLFLDLVRDGAQRFGWKFFTNFPSRKAENAGILSPAVGTSLIMVVTALVSLPVGVAAAIYLEEYAPKNWFTGDHRDQRHEPRGRARRSSTACWRSGSSSTSSGSARASSPRA